MPGLPRGRFITLEGGEGAGKSTQARLLANWLNQLGIDVDVTREPGGSPGAEEVRSLLVTGEVGRWDPLTETLLHYAARRDHVVRRIEPALASGRWVVCDRFIDSTLAYQGFGLGVDQQIIAQTRTAVLGGFAPDLTLVLDVSPETRRSRTAGRGGAEDRYERMSEEFHARVRSGFDAIARMEPQRCQVIVANGDIETVTARIQAIVRSAFSL